jgi:hypothetical protein
MGRRRKLRAVRSRGASFLWTTNAVGLWWAWRARFDRPLDQRAATDGHGPGLSARARNRACEVDRTTVPYEGCQVSDAAQRCQASDEGLTYKHPVNTPASAAQSQDVMVDTPRRYEIGATRSAAPGRRPRIGHGTPRVPAATTAADRGRPDG